MSSYVSALSNSLKFDLGVLPKQISIGIAIGIGTFVFSTTVQKSCMIAGMHFQESFDEDNIPAAECFDKAFKETVIRAPIAEEVFFRGLLQTLLKKALVHYLPQLAAPSATCPGKIGYALNMPLVNVISSSAIGLLFGAVHYLNYEKGGGMVALMGSVSGLSYGLAKEKYGLPCAIVAHVTHNFMVTLLDKHYPHFLADQT